MDLKDISHNISNISGQILEFLPDATLMIDVEGKVILWSSAMEQLTGIAKEEMMGTDNYPLAFYHEKKPMLVDLVQQSDANIEKCYPEFRREGSSITAKAFTPAVNRGKGAHVWSKAGQVYDQRGVLAGYLQIVRNISDSVETESKLAETATGLEKVNAELLATNRELSASNQQLIAHEFELREQYLELKETRESVETAYRMLYNIIDFLPDATFVIDKDKRVVAWNSGMEDMTGVNKDDVLGTTDYAVALYGNKQNVLIDYVGISEEELARQNRPWRYRKKHVLHNEGHMSNIFGKEEAFLSVLAGPILDASGQQIGAIESIRDISDQVKDREEALRNELLLRQITENMSDVILMADLGGAITYASPSTKQMLGYDAAELLSCRLPQLIIEADRPACSEMLRALSEGKPVDKLVFRALNSSGQQVWLEINANPLVNRTDVLTGSVLGCRDVSERIALERSMAYIALHDQLTGIYNRDYFEQQIEQLDKVFCPAAGVITCDVDGLKITNDTLGHSAGDDLLIMVARILQMAVGDDSALSRIGGDEFAVIIANTDGVKLARLCDDIRRLAEEMSRQYPRSPLSLSLGYALRNSPFEPFREVYRRADNSMSREKLHRRQSNRSALVSALMVALEARDYITEGHADRLQELATAMARSLGLSEQQITDLKLLAQFHDIGKVGIPDGILFKPGRLTPEEYTIMKTHTEIGHRIALAAPDLLPIADWILKHHEWWNGTGYPLGLKGESIPLECRILSIADAYDAMTNDRPYRMAMSQEDAFMELEKGKGTQFDPDLIDIFKSLALK